MESNIPSRLDLNTWLRRKRSIALVIAIEGTLIVGALVVLCYVFQRV